MNSKFVSALSVIVLAAVVQVYGNAGTEFGYGYNFSNGANPAQIEHIVDQIINEFDQSMNLVLLQQQPGVIGEVSATQELLTVPNLTGVADDLLQKLKALLDAAFEKARQAIQFAKDKINEIADKAQSFAKQQMQGIEDGLRKQLDDIKEKAKASGVNIDDCLAGNEDRLLDLPNKFAGELVHCVSDQVNKAISYADDAIKQIQSIVDKVTNIKQEIEDCGSGFKAFICLTKLGVEIGKDIVMLPLQIEADVTSAVASIAQLKGNVEKCGSDKISEMGKGGQEMLTTISVCVAAKGI